MKCTCKEWDHWSPIHNVLVDAMRFCPWCISPLLPDPVEKVQWIVDSSRTDRSFPISEESAIAEITRRMLDYPEQTHSIKSITTIARVHKIVTPKWKPKAPYTPWLPLLFWSRQSITTRGIKLLAFAFIALESGATQPATIRYGRALINFIIASNAGWLRGGRFEQYAVSNVCYCWHYVRARIGGFNFYFGLFKMTKPRDIQLPSIIQSESAKDAYCERICIISEGQPITDLMKTIALTEALEIDRTLSGFLKLWAFQSTKANQSENLVRCSPVTSAVCFNTRSEPKRKPHKSWVAPDPGFSKLRDRRLWSFAVGSSNNGRIWNDNQWDQRWDL